ncbi:MAG: ferric reductase-like transmembrane domain-containing protein [Novosphingobium sp.]|nr:ferric reductase-like transmembrane domain-containing protein [Novosphingobium sp.]
MRTWTKLLLWLVLALPAMAMIAGFARGELAMDMLHPTGEMSVRMMLLAMLPGPLADFFGHNRFLRGWIAARRYFGVAAFGFAMLHLIFYVIDMGALGPIIDELELPSIWTGWLALLLMAPAAAISFDAAMRAMKRNWKRVQRVVYVAFALGIIHWLLLGWEWKPAAIHAAPLILAWLLRLIARRRASTPERTST